MGIWINLWCFLNVYIPVCFYLFLFCQAAPCAGSSFPDQGLNPGPLERKRVILTSGLQGSPCLYLSSLLLADTWDVSSLQLIQIKLFWIFMFMFLCEHMLSFLLGKYLGWLIWVCAYLTFSETVSCFTHWLYHFSFPPAVSEHSSSFTSLPAHSTARFLTSAILLYVLHELWRSNVLITFRTQPCFNCGRTNETTEGRDKE